MEKILKVHSVNDYARYIGAEELHPLISVIHYDELEHCRHALMCVAPGQIGGKINFVTEFLIRKDDYELRFSSKDKSRCTSVRKDRCP